jgi:hypothetical protein
MDEYGFIVKRVNSHYMLYRYGIFKCSGDTEREIEEERRNILSI